MSKISKLTKLLEDINKINEAVNLDIINLFIENKFSKDEKKELFKANNLRLVKMPEGWVLMNYDIPVSYRDNDGKVYLNNSKYSVTTSKIRGQVKNGLMNSSVEYLDIDEQGLLKKIYHSQKDLK